MAGIYNTKHLRISLSLIIIVWLCVINSITAQNQSYYDAYIKILKSFAYNDYKKNKSITDSLMSLARVRQQFSDFTSIATDFSLQSYFHSKNEDAISYSKLCIALKEKSKEGHFVFLLEGNDRYLCVKF